jgi:hypothetical protein
VRGGKLEAALGENGSRFELRGENSIQLYGRKGAKGDWDNLYPFRFLLLIN